MRLGCTDGTAAPARIALEIIRVERRGALPSTPSLAHMASADDASIVTLKRHLLLIGAWCLAVRAVPYVLHVLKKPAEA